MVLSIRDVATRCGVGLGSTEEGSVLFRAPFVSVPDGPDADPAAFSDPRADPTASFATRAANIAFTDVVDADEDAAISAAASAALARARSRARAASSSSSAAAASATDSTGVRSAPGFVSGSVCSEFAARVRSLRLADAATAVSASMNVSFISFENGRLFAASFSVRRASVTSSGGGGGHASGASPENSVPETPEPIPRVDGVRGRRGDERLRLSRLLLLEHPPDRVRVYGQSRQVLRARRRECDLRVDAARRLRRGRDWPRDGPRDLPRDWPRG